MLKPVLHAGEVGLSSAVNGTVIDSSTGKPIVGGTTVVALEQKDGSGVDRVILSTLTDANGNFALCPVPTGSYDLVVIAVNGAGLLYAATVTTGVQASTAVGNIPVTPESNANGTITGPASLTGVVQTGGRLAQFPRLLPYLLCRRWASTARTFWLLFPSCSSPLPLRTSPRPIAHLVPVVSTARTSRWRYRE
jgi:hypothetical protein